MHIEDAFSLSNFSTVMLTCLCSTQHVVLWSGPHFIYKKWGEGGMGEGHGPISQNVNWSGLKLGVLTHPTQGWTYGGPNHIIKRKGWGKISSKRGPYLNGKWWEQNAVYSFIKIYWKTHTSIYKNVNIHNGWQIIKDNIFHLKMHSRGANHAKNIYARQ